MRTSRQVWVSWPASLLLIAGIAAGSGSFASVTSLLLDSGAGEPVGQGEFHFYTTADGTLGPDQHFPSTAEEVHLSFLGPFNIFWSLNFWAPPGEVLAVGSYEGAASFFPLDPGQPGLHVGGNSGYCLNAVGRFEVKQIGFDTTGALEHFWATFEQDCAGAPLLGEVRFNADVPVVLEAPSRRTIAVGHKLSFEVRGFELSGNPVALTAASLPSGATFSDAMDGTGPFAWAPEAGQEGHYRLDFGGRSAAGDTDVVYTSVDAIPDFDDFDHPITFTTLPFESELSGPEVSIAADDPVCTGQFPGPPGPLPGQAQGSVWYAYTPAEDGGVLVRFQAASPPGPLEPPPPSSGLSVYTGERGALESITCARSVARFPGVAGRTYHIMVELPAASLLGVSALALPPPPANDDIDAATVVRALPFSDAVDTRGAMTDPEEPRHCIPSSGGAGGGGVGPIAGGATNVWYAYTPSEDTRVTVDSSDSNYSTQMTAFSGAPDALVPLGCDPARLSFTAAAGRTYHVMIAGSILFIPQSTYGDMLRVLFTGQPALHVQVAVDAVGAFDPRTGAATLHGTARCSRPARIVVDGLLQQERRHVQGDFEAVVLCDGATPWQATVTPDASGNAQKRFVGGPAAAVLHATGVPNDNPEDAAVDNGRISINLKGGPPR
jgi:hypothetical protein